jgi:hypothetical protein
MYLCQATAVDVRGFHFLAVPITAAGLSDLKSGARDLRDTLLGAGAWFQGWAHPDTDWPQFTLDATELKEEWLPDAGFFLSEFLEPAPQATTEPSTGAGRNN